MKSKADRKLLSQYHYKPNSSSGIALTTAKDVSLFGPRSLPIFYTALKSVPRKFQWEDSNLNGQPRAILVTVRQNGVKQPLYSYQYEEYFGLSFPIKEIELSPDTIYEWKIENSSEPTVENTESIHNFSSQKITVAEGCFWILSAEKFANAHHVMNYFNSDNPAYDRIAMALLLAEKQLFQESLILCENAIFREPRPGHSVITNYVRATIYRYMREHLSQQLADFPMDLPVYRYAGWIESREKYHRSLVAEQIQKRV